MRHAIVAYNVRSHHNVGSFFRTADAIGITRIYLVGHTPTPIDRFGREVGNIAKVSLGAEKTVPWEYCADSMYVIEKLKKDGFYIVALEQDARSLDYKQFKPTRHTAFIVGEEVSGISREVLNSVDAIVEIPMNGKKESLNVSVALGVALFRILNK